MASRLTSHLRRRVVGGTTGYDVDADERRAPHPGGHRRRRRVGRQAPPERGVWLAEIAKELVGDLAHRLGLLRQLRQVVPVVDGLAAERLAGVDDAALVGPDERDLALADIGAHVAAVPLRPARVVRALDADEAAARGLASRNAAATMEVGVERPLLSEPP